MLNELAKRCFESAKEKGFEPMKEGNEDFHIPRDIMLIVSELSEALEALRCGYRVIEPEDVSNFFNQYRKGNRKREELSQMEIAFFQARIKDTFEDEIADTFIRLLHLCGMLGINIEQHIELKLLFNKARPRLHGGKRF